jgi:hypothetical protein
MEENKIVFKKRRLHKHFSSISASDSESKKEENNNHKNELNFSCPQCKFIITLDELPTENILVSCPACGTTNLLRSSQKNKNRLNADQSNPFIKYTRLTSMEKISYKPIMRVKLIGIICIIFGIIFLSAPTLINIKFSLTLIIIGLFILALVPNNKYILVRKNNTINKIKFKDSSVPKNNSSLVDKLNSIQKQFDTSEKIAIACILTIIFLYLITGVNNLEIFLISIFLGLIIIKELTDELIPKHLKLRLKLFLIAFFAIFMIIVIKRIISIVSI